ncbi:MAG: TSUP family transporter [Hyphomicrobiales bacterium]|nr:TSUP family transporter [Hyphomicrobiales bacterium]
MSTLTALLIGIVVLLTAMISGVFGMAGGLILLGILLVVLDVGPAMILLGFTQFASNGWRTLLWRRHVRWQLFGGFAIGALVAFGVMRALVLIPPKGFIYLFIGLLPFATELLPKDLAPDISKPFMAVFCGFLMTVLQIIGGAAGNVLAVFFQASTLDRREIVATKAVMQMLNHALRVIYFGSLVGFTPAGLKVWQIAACMGLAIIGTTLGAQALKRISNHSFRTWSQWLIRAISVIYIVRGVGLML